MPRLICIYNPKSNDGRALALWQALIARPEARDWQCDVLELGREDLDAGLARRLLAAPAAAAVVGVGGDGTHLSVINALKRCEAAHAGGELPPYALVPAGTGNDLGKSFGLEPGTRGLPRVARTILGGRLAACDLGRWRGGYFADALCIGLDAAVLHERDRLQRATPPNRPWRRGYALYLLAAAKTGVAPPTWQAEVTVDGAPWYRGPLVNLVVNNTAVHGGEFEVTPGARWDDGQLDLALFRSLPEYLWWYVHGWRHQPAWIKERARARDIVPPVPCRQIAVTLDRPAPVQTDGEGAGAAARCEITVAPRALRLRLPV